MQLVTLAFVILLAQIGNPGGQYPYPPGQYPGGQYPGGVGIPMPRRSKKTTSTSDSKKDSVNSSTVSGVVQKIEDKSMDVQAEDSRIITFTLTDQTAMPKDLKVGYTVDVTARQDDKGNFIADTIKVTKKDSGEGSSAAQSSDSDAAPESASTRLKGPKYDADDNGPPQLKRGKPAPRPTRQSDEDTQITENTTKPADSAPPAATTTTEDSPTLSLAHPTARRVVTRPAPLDPRDALVMQARDEAANFLEGLPNYVCNENTTRYVSEGHVTDWHAIDVVTLELVYVGGKEDYRNIQINGKPVKGRVEDTGAWSTGEFGTILLDLFSPATAAKFKFVREASLSGFNTSLYDFSVEREHSHWHVQFAAQSIFPSYKGSIWVDKKTARVVRIEMQATNIPAEFPEDAVETAVDYGYISLGTPDKFFLPTHAEILSCERGANACGRNVIEFRNYHKFTGESTIIFDK